jgi:predicted AAA+ superfamily ATPase
MHPLSLAELGTTQLREQPVSVPTRPDPDALVQLLRFGGFPEPFLKGSTRFYNRWRRLRSDQLFKEDLRDLTQIHEIAQMQVLAELLAAQTGKLLNYSRLAGDLSCAVDTVRRWIATLEGLYFCFRIRPWFKNVPKSLRKQPRLYLWDWSMIDDEGARNENLVAGHLLKAVHWWTDIGLGSFELYFLRDKMKREVDFLVVRDAKPWFLVEVKTSGKREISPSLRYFRKALQVPHAFQLALDLPFVARDCFVEHQPVRVPAETLLSQLV